MGPALLFTSNNTQILFVSLRSLRCPNCASEARGLLGALLTNHVAGGHAQGGKVSLYTHVGGPKAGFSYIDLQVADWGGKTIQNCSFGGNAPLQVRPWSYPQPTSVMALSNVFVKSGLPSYFFLGLLSFMIL